MLTRKRSRLMAGIALVLALALSGTSAPADTVDDLLALVSPDDAQSGLVEPELASDSTPSVLLTKTQAEMQAFVADPPAGTPPQLIEAMQAALQEIGRSLTILLSGSSNLPGVLDGIARAASEIESIPLSDGVGAQYDDGRAPPFCCFRIAGAAREFAIAAVQQARAARVNPSAIADAEARIASGDRLSGGRNWSVAVGQYGLALAIRGLMHFDIELFEQNIIDQVGPNAIGYAYAITQGGQIFSADADGAARTDNDAPAVDMTPLKEHFLASVSKTVTGVALQRALQDNDIPVDTPVAAYLPPYWPKGTNVEDLTFEQLLTHKSGFLTSDGNVYAALRANLADGLPALPDGYDYSNANFGLMRILIPRIVGGVATSWDALVFAFPQLESAVPVFYSLDFQNYVQQTIFEPIGIDGNCYNVEADETRYYNFPDSGNPGYDEPSRLLSCGGFGWFLSARELGAFNVFLRYTTTLLSGPSKQQMDQKFLGWLDPAQFSWTNGASGIYHNHGGDWNHGAGDSHTCIMKFPINVEVSLVINSEHAIGIHQCRMLQQQYDASWVAN